MPETLVEKISPVRLFDIFKLFVMIMAVQIGIIVFMPLWLFEIVRKHFPLVVILPILPSILIAYYIYMKTRHIEFSYDSKSFSIKRGKLTSTHEWNKFTKVLLVNTDGGFLIRLYLTEEETFDIPVSKLKLNPFTFRLKVLKLVEESKKTS